MTARLARIKYVGTTVSGVVTQDAEYDVIAWLYASGNSGDVEALFVSDSGALKHFNINSADWQIVRI